MKIRLIIEEVFGRPLIWDSRDGRNRCSIEYSLGLGGYYDDEEKWPEIQEAMINAMIRLEKALGSHVQKIN